MTQVRWLAALLAVATAVLVAAPSKAEFAQSGNVRIKFDAKLQPQSLPRTERVPISVTLDGQIEPVKGPLPPQLDRIEIEINRHGRLDSKAVPRCTMRSIQPATTEAARRNCGRSIVGEGKFTAKILLPEQSPFPSRGVVVAYNGLYRGKPAVLAHIYGTKPAPTSFTLPFQIGRGDGNYGVTLTAPLPQVASSSAYVTGLSMSLGRGAGTRERPYLSSGCPAPAGFDSVVFPLVRASFAFVGAPTLRSTLMRGCKVSK